jgi:hypothetical protein
MAPWTVLFTLATSFLILTSSVRAASPAPTRPLAASAQDRPHEAVFRGSPVAWNYHGVVVDEAGAPVPHATVTFYAPFFKKSVTTAADGRFSIAGESVGGFLLIARNAAGDRQAFRPWKRADGDGSHLPPVRLVLTKPRDLDIRVTDQSARPLSGATVGAVVNSFVVAEGKTDSAGKAILRIPEGLHLQEVFALKEAFGFDSVYLGGASRRVMSQAAAKSGDKPSELRLTPASTVRVHVVDPNGKPIAGMRVAPSMFWVPGRGYVQFLTPMNETFEPRTDAAGVATFGYLPEGGKVRVTAFTDSHWTATLPIVGARTTSAEAGSREATIVVYHREPVRGTVVTADGKPAARVNVEVSGSSYLFDFVRTTAVSDAQGAFEVWLPPESYCAFEARRDKEVAVMQRRIVRAGVPVEPLTFVLEQGTRVHGRVLRAKDKSPVSGVIVGLQPQMTNEYYKLPKEQQLANPRNSRRGIFANIYQSVLSRPDGQFEFYVAPGKYVVQLNTMWRTTPTQIDVAHQKDVAVDLVDNRPERSVLKGRVVLKSDPTRGVPQAKVDGVDLTNDFGNRFSVVADREGRFEVNRAQVGMMVWAGSHDLAGAVQIKPGDKTVSVPIGATASATGTLIEAATGRPAADRQVNFGVRLPATGHPFSWHFVQGATTDASGRFSVKRLVIGLNYDAYAEMERNEQGPFSWHTITEITPKDERPIDLGECKLPAPYHYQPPTLEQLITRALESKKPLDVRLDDALYDSRLFENRILILATSAKSAACRRIFGILYGQESREGDDQAREALGNFTRIQIDSSAPRYAAELKTFLARWNLTSPARDDALLAIVDREGRLVATTTTQELWPKEKPDSKALAAFLKKHEGPVPNAQTRLDEALARAKRENKRVLVEQSASWCGWCHVLARYFDRHRSLIEKDYVWIVVDPRFTHGEAVIHKLRPKAEGGIPWMVILDAGGKPLITSDAAEGNIGYPGDPNEIAHFEKMLRTTARHLSDSEIKLLLADALKK